MELFVSADNVFNTVNYGSYSGNHAVAVVRAAHVGPGALPPAARHGIPLLILERGKSREWESPSS